MDKETRDRLRREHEEKYNAICDRWGIVFTDWNYRMINETPESLAKKYAKDQHLNNVPLSLWDRMAGPNGHYVPGCKRLCEGVCALKRAACRSIGK